MINAKDLVKQTAVEMGLNRDGVKNALAVYEATIDAITHELQEGETVSITKFGKFSVKDVEAREVRNPATGETMTAAAHKAPKFTFSSVIKKLVH